MVAYLMSLVSKGNYRILHEGLGGRFTMRMMVKITEYNKNLVSIMVAFSTLSGCASRVVRYCFPVWI